MDNTRLRTALLSLHGSLVDCERGAFEKAHGPIANGKFLQMLMQDPAFAWLAPLTSLIAQLDELEDEGLPESEREAWYARAQSVLARNGALGARYAERIDISADIAFAHAAALHELGLVRHRRMGGTAEARGESARPGRALRR
jgi:hypothetical protein